MAYVYVLGAGIERISYAKPARIAEVLSLGHVAYLRGFERWFGAAATGPNIALFLPPSES